MSSQNPIGSSTMSDLLTNAGNLDRALHSNEDFWIDRFGTQRKTYHLVEREVLNLKNDFSTKLGSELLGFQQEGEGSKVVPIELMFKEKVSVLQFPGVDPTGETDSTDGIQKAILAAGVWRSIYFPYGKYKISGRLFIPYSTSWVLETGTELDCNVGGMAVAFDGGTTNIIGEYDLGNRINFVCFNGRAKIFLGGDKITTGYRGFFTPVHSKNIYVFGIDFYNGRETHIFEFNSCKNVLVDNCGFFGNFHLDLSTVYGYEAIQIDYSSQAGAPAGPPWDGTPCNNILITNSRFDMCHGGVGSHAANPDRLKPHTKINFINLEINRTIYPIKCTNLHDSIVLNNRTRGAFQRGLVIDSCKDLVAGINKILYDYDGSGAKVSNLNGGSSIVVNNYVPNAYPSEDIILFNNMIDSMISNPEEGLFLSGGMYISKASRVYTENNIFRNVNKTALLIGPDADYLELTKNKFYNCGIDGDRDVIRLEAGVDAKPNVYIGDNFINKIGLTFAAIRCLSKGDNVRIDFNRFGPNVPPNRKYLSTILTETGYTINGIQNLTNQGDFTPNTLITLPCSVFEFDSIIVGIGTVGNGQFMSHEGYPYSRATGFRVGDYITFPHINGGVVRVDVIDEFTLKIISVSSGSAVRWIKGKKL